MTENHIEELILEAKKVISNRIKRRKDAGGDYNIFSVLRVERDEVFTHSNLIYSFLDPDSGHFMGTTYLNLFAKHVLGFNNPEESWHAVREWPFSDGRIDFVVYSGNFYNAIEMKIDACDQEAQLSRYERYAKSKNPNYEVFYLTITGKDATEQSASGLEKDYRRISFCQHILEWLNCCLGVTPISNKAYNALKQYTELVQKLISDQSRKGDREMSAILQNAENYRAYLELVKSEKNMKKVFLEKFFHTLEDRLKQIDQEFRTESDLKFILEENLFLDNANIRIEFSLDTGKQISMSNGKLYSLLFCLDIGEREGSMALGFSLGEMQGGRMVKGPVNVRDVITTDEDKDNLYKVLNNENNSASGVFDSVWIYWDFIYSEKQAHYNLRCFNDPIIDMLDEQKFEHGMNRIIGNISNHLGRVKQAIVLSNELYIIG